MKILLYSGFSFSVLILLCSLVICNVAWSSTYLPLNKNLTVRLSALSSQGQLQTVSDIVAKTDSLGKIAFNFPSVPSSETTPFLHIQIMDETNVLRQAIVPSPQAGGNVDVGVSEVTDLQARSLLKASTIAGRLTPLHMLIAQTLLRTPTISTETAESIGTAIVAGADAISDALATDGLTSDRLSTFTASLSKGLADASAVYRKSVDDSVAFDQNVEAYRRGESYAILMQALITAGSDAGINLETICTAFASAGEATETAIESNPIIDPVAKAGMRLGFVSGILTLSNYKMLRELINSFNYAGVSPPEFSRMFDLVWVNTTNNLKGADSRLLGGSLQSDIQTLRVQEFNLLAAQDLLMFKVSMEIVFANNTNPEYAALMLDITSQMASMGGIMTGMTPEILMGILGRPEPPPVFLVAAQQVVSQASNTPVLTPFELAAWAYILPTA